MLFGNNLNINQDIRAGEKSPALLFFISPNFFVYYLYSIIY